MGELLEAFERHPGEAAVIAVCVLVVVLLVGWGAARIGLAVRRGKVEGQRVVTLLGAAIATGLSAQGMYVFFRDSVEVPPVLRVVFFAFLEIMVLGSALRAKSSMREKYNAGIDGIAMWAFTVLSALLAATHAHGLGETLFRLSVPLAAAWAWEREMQLERRRRTGRSGLNWTLTPERILIKLGLADPTDRTASEVGAQHRLMQLALAAKKARVARDGGNRRAYARALRRLDKAMDRATELTGLGTDPSRPQTPEEILVGRLSVLYNTESLLDLQPPPPWAVPAPAPRPDPAPAPEPVHEKRTSEEAGESAEQRPMVAKPRRSPANRLPRPLAPDLSRVVQGERQTAGQANGTAPPPVRTVAGAVAALVGQGVTELDDVAARVPSMLGRDVSRSTVAQALRRQRGRSRASAPDDDPPIGNYL
ncbi:hypothetical protein ABGB12_25960 [Actinocorallia sp. B10E7]|uniref:hypothetical protein n=1 Tax=Actinocorallia sp. B10E7 TaxID=3153558 RepID=UPI00325F3CA1